MSDTRHQVPTVVPRGDIWAAEPPKERPPEKSPTEAERLSRVIHPRNVVQMEPGADGKMRYVEEPSSPTHKTDYSIRERGVSRLDSRPSPGSSDKFIDDGGESPPRGPVLVDPGTFQTEAEAQRYLAEMERREPGQWKLIEAHRRIGLQHKGFRFLVRRKCDLPVGGIPSV